MGKNFFESFLHFSTAPVFFAFPFWIPNSVLPCSLKACVSCPPTWAVLRLWQLRGVSITKLQTARSTVLPLDRLLPIPGVFFHISHLIHCSPEEHHPLLLLRQKKKKKDQYSACLLVEMPLSKTDLKSAIEMLWVFT